MAWDPATISAVAALLVACFALLIALAQVLQQYLVTGQLIRLCDSVVFGPLPGQGRRIWEPLQLRFRVVYSIPQFSLDADLWPDNPPHVKSYAIGRHGLRSLENSGEVLDEKLPRASMDSSMTVSTISRPRFSFSARRTMDVNPRRQGNKTLRRRTGEASWVSFWRVVEQQCGHSLRFDHVEYDADRCPTDLVTAPMQVSMRDVAVMGLMAGMQLTSCSFDEKSLSMQGEVGTLTSSSHPVLGPILHFTPRNGDMVSRFPEHSGSDRDREIVENRWQGRTWDVCMVAGKYYNSGARRTARRLDERWIRDRKANPYSDLAMPGYAHSKSRDRARAEKRKEKGRYEKKRTESEIAAVGTDASGQKVKGKEKDRRRDSAPEAVLIGASGRRETTPQELPRIIPRSSQDGPWTMTIPHYIDDVRRSTEKHQPNLGGSKRPRTNSNLRPNSVQIKNDTEPSKVKRQPTVEDELEDETRAKNISRELPKDFVGPDPDLADRIQIAKERQAARRVKLEAIEKDKSVVEDSVKRGAITSPYRAQPNVLLLTQHAHNPTEESEQPESTPEEEAARKREEEREKLRRQRDDERWERNQARNDAITLRRMDIFWLCQMDIFCGYWATPWQHPSIVPLQNSLVGAVTVTLEALLGFLDEKSLLYTDAHPRTWDSIQGTSLWLRDRRFTYPAYAINARGGVIAGGISWVGVRIPAFKDTIIPALELLHSYDWQVAPEVRDQVLHNTELNIELMRLDSWLSYVGRTNEIGDGPNKLLKQTPALMSLLMTEFELDFQNMDLSASEGGLQDIQGLSANIMDFLTDEGLNEAEQMYILVALLRAVKVGQSILGGADTAPLKDILLKDVQAHLV